MPARTLLLRVLFWSLALAALFGAVGVLFSSYDTIWRVAATSIFTSGAAVLMLAASSQVDKPAARRAAQLGAAVVVALYLLSLAAVWRVDELLGPSHEDQLWFTALVVLIVGPFAVVFMRMAASPLTAVAGRAGLVAATVELPMALATVWLPLDWPLRGKLIELAFVLAPFAVLAVLCLIGQGVPPPRHWRWAGVAASAAGFGVSAYGISSGAHQGDEVLVYIVCAGAAVAHANVVALLNLKPNQEWLRRLTIAAGVATAVFVALSTANGIQGDGTLPRLAAASGIVAGCGTIAVALLARVNRRVVVPAGALAGLSEITVVCPLCHRRQSVALGEARCAECGLVIRARVEEPRCVTCGYSLLMFRGPACPECGTRVPGTEPAPATDEARGFSNHG